jgi:hypothetical protein
VTSCRPGSSGRRGTDHDFRTYPVVDETAITAAGPGGGQGPVKRRPVALAGDGRLELKNQARTPRCRSHRRQRIGEHVDAGHRVPAPPLTVAALMFIPVKTYGWSPSISRPVPPHEAVRDPAAARAAINGAGTDRVRDQGRTAEQTEQVRAAQRLALKP